MKEISNVVIFAAAGAHNVGDELIVRSEYRYLRDRYPKSRISVASYDPCSTLLPSDDPNLEFLPYFPHSIFRRPFWNARAFLKTVIATAKADLVVIGGGGIFYDNESGQSFSRQLFGWRVRTALARIFRKKVLFWGVGIDVKPENAAKLAGIFSGANVTVRDAGSSRTLESIGIGSRIVPDPAFLEAPRDFVAPECGRKLAGVSLRNLYLPRGIEDVETIVKILRESGFEPVFINHSLHAEAVDTNDRSFLESVARKETVESTASVAETYGKYPNLSLVVAMRLHAGVLSAISGIPTVLLSYSKKTDAFARAVGLDEVVPVSEFTPDSFKTALENALRKSEGGRNFAIMEKCAKLKKEAHITYGEVFYGLECPEE